MVLRSVFLCLVLSLILYGLSPVYAQPPGGGGNAPIEQPAPVPDTLTVAVNCAAGDTITAALQEPAVELTIEVSGICSENVIVGRSLVTIRGVTANAEITGVETEIVSPHFGITLFIPAGNDVVVEDLTVSAAALWAIGVTGFGAGLPTRITRCSLERNDIAGLGVFRGRAQVQETDFSENGRLNSSGEFVIGGAASVGRYSSVDFRNCSLDATLPVFGGAIDVKTALTVSNYSSVSVGISDRPEISDALETSLLHGTASVAAADYANVSISGRRDSSGALRLVDIEGRFNVRRKSRLNISRASQSSLPAAPNIISGDSRLETNRDTTLGATLVRDFSVV